MADIVKLIYKGDEMAQWGGGGVSWQMHVTALNIVWSVQWNPGDTVSITYTAPRAWFIDYRWRERVYQGKVIDNLAVSWDSWYNLMRAWTYFDDSSALWFWSLSFEKYHENWIPVAEWETITMTLSVATWWSWSQSDPGGNSVKIFNFYYFD